METLLNNQTKSRSAWFHLFVGILCINLIVLSVYLTENDKND